MARRMQEERKGDVRARLSSLAKVAARFESWAPAGQVLTRVRSVVTCFAQVDRATRVAGWPTQRFALVHGPSNQGKTMFCHGLGLSFLRAGHYYAFVDAEYTTPEDWLVKLMAEHASNPAFLALRPDSYEQTVGAVRELVVGLIEARESKELPPNQSALIVVDSIRKLVPEGLLAKLLRGDGGIDGAKGRAAMMKAALNAQWLDELTPLLYRGNCAMVFIARETENTEADGMYDLDYKVGGGRALFFESSLACRVSRASWVKRGSDEHPEILGEKHRVRVYKTKVGGKDGKYVDAHFYTSNGKLVPEGFDHARSLVELGLELGLLERAKPKAAKRSEAAQKPKGGGSWIDWASTGERFNGEHAMVKALSDDPRLFGMLDAEVRERTAVEIGGIDG